MINEIAPYVFNNAWNIHRKCVKGDKMVLFLRGDVLLYDDGKGDFTLPDCIYGQNMGLDLIYLYSIDDVAYYTSLDELDNMTIESPLVFKNISVYRSLYKPLGYEIITALGLYRWYVNTRFCGRCGNKMHHSKNERAMECSVCSNIVYPTISPAVTVAIINGNKILLAKNAVGTFKKYALIAGFTEIGESFEETVVREVMEEVGLKVKDIKYYKSQPWGLSSAQMVGFFAKLDGDDKVTLDTNELAEARWFTPDEIDWELDDVSLTYEMIRMFKEGRITAWKED